jgi:hypothetical protein
MAKQPLSGKNLLKLHYILKVPIISAYVSSSWPHGWAEVWFDHLTADWVNRKNGARKPKVRWGRHFIPSYRELEIKHHPDSSHAKIQKLQAEAYQSLWEKREKINANHIS